MYDIKTRVMLKDLDLGGDTIQVYTLPDRHSMLLVDVQSHGRAADPYRQRVIDAAKRHISEQTDLGEEINAGLFSELETQLSIPCTTTDQESSFATAVYVETHNRGLRLIRAGHPGPRVFRGDGTVTDYAGVQTGGAALGWMSVFASAGLTTPSYETEEVPLEVGDIALFYTDGLSDIPSSTNIFEKVGAAIVGIKDRPLDELVIAIQESALEALNGRPLRDDTSFALIRREK